jgi:hypothetical protein
MNERAPKEQAVSPPPPWAEPGSLEERVDELEERVEGLEYLLATRLAAEPSPITAPKAAQAVAEERYGGSD